VINRKNHFADGCPFGGFEHLPPKMSVHVPVGVDLTRQLRRDGGKHVAAALTGPEHAEMGFEGASDAPVLLSALRGGAYRGNGIGPTG